MTLIPGFTLRAALLTPLIRPPPPMANSSRSISGASSSISRPIVPCPAITTGSAKAAFHHQAHRGRQVIVTDAGGHAPKVFEGADMAVEKALLLLAGKGHHKAPSAVGQPHHKDLHRLPDPADDGDGLPPIHLRILAGFELQRHEERRGLVILVSLRQRQAYPRLSTLIPLCL